MSKLKRVLAHLAAIVTLYVAFSFALFLGLQVDAAYGNIAMVGAGALAVAYALLVRRWNRKGKR